MDWSVDVCSSDLFVDQQLLLRRFRRGHELAQVPGQLQVRADPPAGEQQRRQPQQREGDAQAGVHGEPSVRGECFCSSFPRRRESSCLAVEWCVGSRSEEHTSELQSLMRISYAVFCLKKKINITE